MTTTTTPTDQDQFIIRFVHWLYCNYEEIAFDQYRHIYDRGPLEKNTVLKTTAECLDLFREQQKLPLPLPASDTEINIAYKILAQAQEAMQKNKIFFDGFLKIQTLIAQSPLVVAKQQLSDIIVDTMNQIS